MGAAGLWGRVLKARGVLPGGARAAVLNRRQWQGRGGSRQATFWSAVGVRHRFSIPLLVGADFIFFEIFFSGAGG